MKTPGIAHIAYLLGNKGEAIVVDPRRDIDEVLAAARERDLAIKFILETHRQEDFVIGSAALAKATGAKIVSGDHPLFGNSDIRMRDGEELDLIGLRIRALHTPGHTPESACYAVFLPDAPGRAWGAFTGDTLFIGETGRTDLPDREKTSDNARLLHASVHEKLLPLGDQTLLWPAHGSGSVCGGNIAERDDSTLGLERAYNPVFVKSVDDFARAKVAERIPRPPYFSLMEALNLEGGKPLAVKPGEVPFLPPKKFASDSRQGLVLDARDPEAFASGHLPGSLNLWLAGLPVFGGWVAGATTQVYLIVPRAADVEVAVLHLARVGVDHVAGVLAGGFEAWRDAGLPIERTGATTPREIHDAGDAVAVLDVRDDQEFEAEGHIEGARHMYVGYLDEHFEKIQPPLPRHGRIALVCSVGHRAGLATSILRRRGFTDVANVLGGMTAWEEVGLPRKKGPERTVTTMDIEGARR
ncbi:MBL fold metallo-hydrolase [Sorangium sp. So ce854]|uniref:MBL fold metallo-hydrolase n=1 Tax=Sorangium sp. So ce854 TaxID=3133322 RepID=UPI003F5D8D47